MCKKRQNLQTIHYCTILSAGQWDFLLEGRFSPLRQKCLHRLMNGAVRTRTAYKIKGIDIVLEVGQVAASEVELAEFLDCNRKTVGKLIDSFNRLGMLTTRTNNRTSVHSLHFLTGWYVGGVLVTNPHYVRPSSAAKGQTGDMRTPVPDSLPSVDEPGGTAVDCHTRGKETDSTATGAVSLSSSLLLSGSYNPSADAHDGDSHNPPSDMLIADTAVNRHIPDSGNIASGENGAGSLSDAQEGMNGGESNPA